MRTRILLGALVLVSLVVAATYWIVNPISAWKKAEARKKLAFESLVERLPKGKPAAPNKPLNAESIGRWQALDMELASAQNGRAELLKALHERTRRFFIDSPGEGSSRRVETPEEILLDADLPDDWKQQPGGPAQFPISAGESLSRVDPSDEFHGYHRGGMWNFLYPSGFGFVKDRANVAGFKAHGFRGLGMTVQANWRWRIQHVQLLGILSHQEPVVYLTDRLPSMEQVRQGKTRPLGYFEAEGLTALQKGEDLFIARKDDSLRMLGALRATKTCQQCHDAEVGDLLGALTYALSPVPKVQSER